MLRLLMWAHSHSPLSHYGAVQHVLYRDTKRHIEYYVIYIYDVETQTKHPIPLMMSLLSEVNQRELCCNPTIYVSFVMIFKVKRNSYQPPFSKPYFHSKSPKR